MKHSFQYLLISTITCLAREAAALLMASQPIFLPGIQNKCCKNIRRVSNRLKFIYLHKWPIWSMQICQKIFVKCLASQISISGKCHQNIFACFVPTVGELVFGGIISECLQNITNHPSGPIKEEEKTNIHNVSSSF